MALTWDQMSKDQRNATGMTKKEYNAANGFGKQGELAGTAPSSAQPTGGANTSATEAVQRSQSWADLSKDEKQTQKDAGIGKADYNKSTGYRAEEIALQKAEQDNNNSDSSSGRNDPLNTQFSDMDFGYREEMIADYGTKEDAKKAHKDARKTAGTYTTPKLEEQFNLNSLEDYDTTSGGRGYKEGEDRLSVRELENLRDRGGFSEEEIYNYAMTGAAAGSKKGSKAQDLLDSWLQGFKPNDPGDPGDPGDSGEGDPGQGDPGGGNPGGGNPGGGNPGGGNPGGGNPGGGNPGGGNPGGGNPGGGNPGGGIDTGGGNIDTGGGDINQGGDGGDGGDITNEDIGNQDVDVTQDNDITVNGDGNWVNQDNSVRTYGGDTRIFNYTRGGDGGDAGGGSGGFDNSGGWFDTPASMATMGGFYAVDDSPAKQAAFTDLHSDLNAQKQQRYAGQGFAVANMFSQFDPREVSGQQFQETIDQSIATSYARADDQMAWTFGDIWNENYAPDNWVMPDPPSTIESNVDDMVDDINEDIEDM